MGFFDDAFARGLDILTAFNYSKSVAGVSGARFDWDARPFNNTDKQVEDGDQVMVACRRWDINDGGKIKNGFIGWEWKDNAEVAKFYELSGDDVWDHKKAIIFTVKKTPRNKISLETSIGGSTRQMTNVGPWVTFQKSLSDSSYSTGWKPTKDGYALHFESQKPHTVRTDYSWADGGLLRADGTKDNESVRFSLVKYDPTPTPFSWDTRPKATDGVQIEEGDRVTMTVGAVGGWQGGPLFEDNLLKPSTGCYVKVDLYKNQKPLVFTVRKNVADGGIQFETVLDGQTLLLCSPEDIVSAFGRMLIMKDPKPENASTGWEAVDGGYRLYFKAHERNPINGNWYLMVGQCEPNPRIFKLDRVAEQAKL